MDKSEEIKEAILLAGGLGTRLRSEIGEIPKPLAPVNGIPFLQILLDFLNSNGINRVILAVGYKWEQVQHQFGEKYQGIELIYSIENTPLGTGGALKLALEKVNSKSVFVLNGDTLFSIPLQELRMAHQNNNALCSLALLYLEKNSRYGNVLLNQAHYIRQFIEKGDAGAGWINGGIYLLQKSALAGYQLNEPFSFEKDYLSKNADGKNILGVPFTAYFKDIGIPADYRQFEQDIKNKTRSNPQEYGR